MGMEYLTVELIHNQGLANKLYQLHTATYLANIWNKKFVFDSKYYKKASHSNIELNELFEYETKDIQYDTIIEVKMNQCWNWKHNFTNREHKGNVLLRGLF